MAPDTGLRVSNELRARLIGIVALFADGVENVSIDDVVSKTSGAVMDASVCALPWSSVCDWVPVVAQPTSASPSIAASIRFLWVVRLRRDTVFEGVSQRCGSLFGVIVDPSFWMCCRPREPAETIARRRG
ncbi:MAG: hypothetical protein ACK4IT_00245 [Thioalkalivibrionaceae bacterium]